MQPRRVVVAALVALALLGAAGGALHWRFGRAQALEVVTVGSGAVEVRVVGPGTVQARVPVTVASRITAHVTRIDVDVGDAVERGQVVALLDSRDLAARRGALDGQQAALVRNTQAAQAAVAKAQADLELARSRQRRDAELLRTGFVSQAVVDASDAALAAAQSGLDGARATHAARLADAKTLAQETRVADAQLSFARIESPAAGVVIARSVEVGSVVAPGTPMLRIVDPAGLWVAMRVDESLLARVQLGQRAEIRLRSGEVLAGKVARIARQSDPATRELEVDVAFDAPPVRFAIDQEANVTIASGAAAGLVVPVAALARDAQGRQGVWIVDADERARLRPVRTAEGDTRQVLVVEGLAAGDRVVARADGVRAGGRVKPATAAPAAQAAAAASATPQR